VDRANPPPSRLPRFHLPSGRRALPGGAGSPVPKELRMPARLLTGSILGLLALGLALAARGAHGAPAADPVGRHWAFGPVQRPRVPTPDDHGWVRTPVDAFVLARLQQHGPEPALPADRRTLLRRVYFDLIGLPPTPEEQRAFLDDPSPDAYEKV